MCVCGDRSSNSTETIQTGMLVGLGLVTRTSLVDDLWRSGTATILDEFTVTARRVSLV